MKIILSILIITFIVVIGGTLIIGPQLQSALMKFKPEPNSIEVRMVPATTGKLIETASAPGKIEPHTKVVIFSEVSARIKALPFDEGDKVRKGEVIVRLDDRDLKAALDSRMAQREENRFRIESERARIMGQRGDLEYAQRTLIRQQALYDSGDIALSFLDDARQRVEFIHAQIDAAVHTISVMESAVAASEANIARAERDLENTVLRAPMDGLITILNVEVGEAVLGMVSNMGTQIMVIADLSRMLMIARVPESDIARVKEGQTARIHLNAYPDEVFSGSVTKIALQQTTEADGSGHFKTEIEIDLRNRQLRSGLNANVDIEINRHEGIRVESQAILDRLIEDLPEEIQKHPLIDQSKRITSVVYRVVEDETVCTPVKTGPSDLTHTIVLEGLQEADMVVVGPYKVLEKIEHGKRVKQAGGMDTKETGKANETEALAGDQVIEESVGSGAVSSSDAASSQAQ